jgi:peptide/nickel transport system ATP-binding protein
MSVVLKARDLGVRFTARRGALELRGEDVRALDGVSFSLARGETLAVVGESGSGKTTLLRAILGLVTPTAGSVELWGREIPSMTNTEKLAARRRCGYVIQDPYGALPPTLTVLGAVTEPWNIVRRGKRARLDGIAKAKDLLTELKFPRELWGASVRYSLSGGQRQRVAVARALILDPELLLCDEPTAMQDVSTRAEVTEVLNRGTAAGMSMILVTHDLLLARRAARRAIVLYKGRVVESGGTDELLERPTHSYTRALLAALPRL